MSDNAGSYNLLLLGAGSAVSGAVSYVFYRMFRRSNQTAQEIRHVVVWHPDSELANYLEKKSNHYLAYAAVEGVVKEIGRSLHSSYINEPGVIKRSQVVEHKIKLENGFWVDVKRVLQNGLETVPFTIVKELKSNSKNKVEVLTPCDARQLHDELETTYDRFEQSKDWMDTYSGEISKGIHTTEHMLLTGTHILGIGKIMFEEGQIKLCPPDDENRCYILTRMRMRDLHRLYDSQSSSYKIIAATSACICVSLLAYAFYWYMGVRYEQYQQRLQFQEIRRSLSQQRHTHTDSDDEHSGEPEMRPGDACVVCYANFRQIITLPCGHFAMCADCAEVLLIPKTCPVCRTDIDKFVPVYRP